MGTLIFDLFRHAEAAKVPGIQDFHRPLSETGIAQAVRMQEVYARSGESDRVVWALHSPALRTYTTQMIVLGEYLPQQTQPLYDLWPADDSPINDFFERYAYDIRKYVDDPAAREVLELYGQSNAKQLWSVAHSMTGIVNIAGHAVLQNAIAYALSGDKGVWHHAMNPCSYIRLAFEDGEYAGHVYRAG